MFAAFRVKRWMAAAAAALALDVGLYWAMLRRQEVKL